MRLSLLVMLGLGLPMAAAMADDEAKPALDAKQLAKTVPIFDMHLHVVPFSSVESMKQAMDGNNVRWGGGVGILHENVGDNTAAFRAALPGRYFPSGGQGQLTTIFTKDGRAALTDPTNPRFVAMMEKLEQDFAAGEIFGVGEIIFNNANSHPNSSFRRKVPLDSETVKRMVEVAAKYRGTVQIHAEPDGDTAAQIETLLKMAPDVTFILAHCMATGGPDVPRSLMARFPNVVCDLSARSPPIIPTNVTTDAIIFTYNSMSDRWRTFIEDYPDRFVVGSDPISGYSIYDDIIGNIRNGLLSKLKPETVPKVAYQNALRIYRLQE